MIGHRVRIMFCSSGNSFFMFLCEILCIFIKLGRPNKPAAQGPQKNQRVGDFLKFYFTDEREERCKGVKGEISLTVEPCNFAF